MENESTTPDLSRIVRVLRRRAALIVVCAAATAAAAFTAASFQRNQYTASAEILFRNAQVDQQAAGLPVINTSNPQTQVDTNLKLASLPRISAETAAKMGEGLTPKQVQTSITVSQVSDTDLADISATSSSPSLAAALANTYANQVIIDQKEATASYFAKALQAVQSAQGSFTDRATSLRILSQLQSSEVQLAQPATRPGSPSSPKIARDAALGGLLGLLLGLALALLYERFDTRLREPGDLETVYGVPLVGVVPESAALSLGHDAVSLDGTGLPAPEAEIFGLLRAHIRYFNVDREMRTVVVVSAAPGDGKTTVASSLAVAAASVGSRVLFLEADLRRPTAATRFGVDSGPGLTEILIGTATLAEASQRVVFAHRGDTELALDVVAAGSLLPPNPAQMIESHAMMSLLSDAKANYDLVLIDTPPLALLSDAFPLLRVADGVLIVSRVGHNKRDVARRLRDTLESADAVVIGVVANGFRPPRGHSSYGYGYSYPSSGYPPSSSESPLEPVSNGPRAPSDKLAAQSERRSRFDDDESP